MTTDLYVVVPPNSSHRAQIETIYKGSRSKVSKWLSFGWGEIFLCAGENTQTIEEVREDGKTIALIQGRPQSLNGKSRSVNVSRTETRLALLKYKEPFSLVFINNEAEEVWFVRDTFGLSTFYYAVVDDCILFSTNVKEIIAISPKLRTINPNAIGEYLVFNHIAGSNTNFSDIKQIEIGTAAVVNSLGIQIREVWDPCFKSADNTVDAAITQIENKLKEIVREQFEIAGSKTGLLLSGGIDSSLLCSYLAEIRPNLPTFSVGIPNYERNEEAYFTQVSQKYQTRHTTFKLDNEQFAQNLRRAIWHMEEPLRFLSAIPQMLTCQIAKANNCDWLITGEGCDGVFSGGRMLVAILAAATERELVQSKYRETVLFHSVTAHDVVRSILADSYEIDLSERLRILECAARKHGTNNFENMLHAFHLRTYSEKAPPLMYKMSAASSVTIVSPFLTKSFVDFLFTVPFQIRNYNGISKYPMVNLASRIFGETFANRRKDGFNVPNSRWFRSDEGLGRYRPLLFEERTLARPFYKPEALRKALLFRLENDSAPLDYLLWSVLNLELWVRMFIEGEELQSIGT